MACLALLAVIVVAMMLPAQPSPERTRDAPPPDTRLAETRAELDEVKRVLNDVQSAVAQRDREIAAAEDELRMLRKELEGLRAKPTPAP